jgi:hypothetical protein
MYARQVLPHDRTIMQAFDYTIMDLHSAGTLHCTSRCSMKRPRLNAISVTLDRYENAPTVRDLLPTLRTIWSARAFRSMAS